MNLNYFKTKILTPNKICLEKKVWQVILPTKKHGNIGILSNHIPIIGIISPGCSDLYYENNKQTILLNNGLFSFKNNELIILTDFASLPNKTDTNNYLSELQKKIIKNAQDFNLPKNLYNSAVSYLNPIMNKQKK